MPRPAAKGEAKSRRDPRPPRAKKALRYQGVGSEEPAPEGPEEPAGGAERLDAVLVEKPGTEAAPPDEEGPPEAAPAGAAAAFMEL